MPDLTYTRIIPDIDLTSLQVQRFLDCLSTAEAPRPLVFETHADDAGIRYYLGRAQPGKSPLRALIRANLPEARTLRADRPVMPERVARLKLSPKTAPLASDALHHALHTIYGVLASRRKGEQVAIQVVLGRGYRPVQVPARIADPDASITRLLSRGSAPAPHETRKRVADHAAQPRIEVTVRVGVTSAVAERRRQLRGQLLGAFAQLEAPGARLSLVNEAPEKWGQARPAWSGIPMVASQLGAVLGWPVDDVELPGLPPRHPRLLAPPNGIERKASVFAVSTAPGTEECIGMTPLGRLQHLAVTGGTGSGKSEIFAVLALSDITSRTPLVLVEPKSQLVDTIIARAPKEAAGRIIVIDAADETPVGFNPLDMGDRDPGPVVDGILEVFKTTFEDGWGPRTEDLLHVSLHTLHADGRRRGVPHTLLDLVPLISDDGYRRTVIGAVADDPTLAAYWATFNGLSPAHRASIVAAPLNKLRKLVLRKNVAAILGQARPKIRLRDIWKSDHAILVPLNDALIGPGAAQLLGGLIIAEVWLATKERALEQHPQARPGMVFVDEVQHFLHLPTSIDDALATSRSYGVGWHLAAQGRSQMPRTLALALELNARNQITFQASPHDAAALTRMAPQLTAEDFQALDRFHIYANLVVDGAPAGWFSAKTLPPTTPSGYEDTIRAAYRERFAGDTTPTSPPFAVVPDTDATSPSPQTSSSTGAESATGAPSHQRKRRRL